METLWLCTSLTSGWFFAPCWIRINLSSSVEVAGGDFSGCASPPSLSLNHNKSPDVMVRSQTHWLPASWDAAPTSLDLDQTACPLVCFLLSSSTTCHSHCILILRSVIKSNPPSPVSFRWVSFCRVPFQCQHCCCCCCSDSTDCLLRARHWPLHDHMFLLCHQPKGKQSCWCSLWDKAEKSLRCLGDLFNLL